MRIIRGKGRQNERPGGRSSVRFVAGDITTIGTEAIVNAANSWLSAGGGVCGAIFAAAGRRDLEAACDQHSGCPTGSAVVTPAFRLAAHGTKHIIHAVGPVYDPARADQCDEQLIACYRSALRLAESLGVWSIAIPAISTGHFYFPVQRAANLVAQLFSTEIFNVDDIVLMALEPEKVKVYADAYAAARSA